MSTVAEERTITNFHLQLSAPESPDKLRVRLVDDPITRRNIEPSDVEFPLKQTYDVKSLGRVLYECLFRGEIRQSFETCREEHCTGKDRVGLRLILDIQNSPDQEKDPLLSLPWELLHDDKDWLALDPTLSITRRLNIQRRDEQDQEKIRPPMRVLLTCAEPDDKPRFGGERFLNEVFEAIQPIEPLKVVKLPHATLEELESHIKQGFHIVHFLGHGAIIKNRAALLLEHDVSPTFDILLATSLVNWIKQATIRPRLMVLTACHSGNPSAFGFLGVATALLDAGVEAVVAMQAELYITTRTEHDMAMQMELEIDEARQFTQAFYQTLAKHLTVDEAMQAGRKALINEYPRRLDAGVIKLLDDSEEQSTKPTIQWRERPLTPLASAGLTKSKIPFPGWAVPILFLHGDGWLGQGAPESPIPWEKDQKEMIYVEVEEGSFYIDKYPVTCDEYWKFVQERGYSWQNPWRDKYEGEGVDVDALPATGITLDEALEYAQWAGKHIPTPAEWQQAALSGYPDKQAPFPWGHRFLGNLCNTQESGYLKPRPVKWSSAQRAYDEHGKMLSNSSLAGMCDIVGNVAEWTQTEDGQSVLCGGSFRDPSDHCTIQRLRLISQRDFKNRAVGFRCAASWSEFIEQQHHDTD